MILSRRLTLLALLALIIPIGLAIRMAPLHLPWSVSKYGGSTLWAVALYLLLAALLPKLRPPALFLLATSTAILVELSRLTHLPVIDAFRLTLPGKILLGRFFSLKNIAAYALAIALTALLDSRLHPGRPAPHFHRG